MKELNENELNNVAGGTNREYSEIAHLLPKKTVRRYNTAREEMLSKAEVTQWLKTNLNIDAKMNTNSGIFVEYTDFGALGGANTYTRNGETLSHEEVMAETRAFLNK